MQAVEGEIDSAHVSWLHAPLQVDNSPFRGRFDDAIVMDGAPKLTVKPTDYGFCYGARRDADSGEYYWRVTHWLFPTFSLIPAQGFPRGGRCWIPLDDTHISVIQYSYHPERPLTEAEVQTGKSSPQVAPVHYRLPDGAIIDICRDVRHADNDYRIDREMQRTQNFTGIQAIRSQDTAMTESMGGIVDRTQEHLGTTDVAVIAARRRLITMARDLQDGIEPSEALQPEIYNVRAVDMVCPQDDFSGSWTSTPRRPAARSTLPWGKPQRGPTEWARQRTAVHRGPHPVRSRQRHRSSQHRLGLTGPPSAPVPRTPRRSPCRPGPCRGRR
jgi:hypothetical protein